MRLKRLIPAAIFSALFLVVGSVFCFVYSTAQQKLPDVTQLNYNYASSGKPLTVGDALKLIKRIDTISINTPALSFCAELKSEKLEGEDVTPVLCNELYFSNNEIKIREFNEKTAVISDALALKLYFTKDAVGKKLYLYGREYTVGGVYDGCDGTVLGRFKDDRERIYINYLSVDNYRGQSVTEFSYINNTQSAAVMEQMQLKSYLYTNFSEKKQVIADFLHLFYIAAYITMIVLGILLLRRLYKRQLGRIRQSLQKGYFRQSLKTSRLDYILLIIGTLAIVGVWVFTAFAFDFSIFIIPRYMPDDNIFDISHYLAAFTEYNRSVNSAAVAGNPFVFGVYSASFRALAYLLCGAVISMITAVTGWYRFIFKR